MMPAPDAPPRQRVLLVNLDFRDFVYSHLWGRAVLDGCARRGLFVDMVAVNPSVGRDLAAELGVNRSALDADIGGTTAYVHGPDESQFRSVVGQILDRHRYDTLILNCDAPLFIHLMLDRERDLAGTRWLVYDRHLHIDLRAHDHDAQLRDRIVASDMHLFTIQEIAIGAELPSSTRLFTAEIAEGTDFVRSLKRLGLTEERIHLQQWPLDDDFFSPQPDAARTDAFVVFTGGDSGRDYATLFVAIRDLPIQVRLCAHRYPMPLPPNVRILPRLPLHQFRDEIARATVVIVPLTGEPPVSGVSVVAMAKMMGKPVIASDNAVIRMHIRSHDAGGYLTPAGDVAMLRALLNRLIGSPADRERLGREARVQAARDLSLRAFVDRMLTCDEHSTSDGSA
jgi:glycosyltransferase involved in cell wall biosynthesis